MDPSGHKCYTFSLSEFKTESKGIRKVLQDKYNLKSKNSVLKIINNHNSFKKAWNSMKGKIKCLVINMHGNPFEISSESKTIMSISQIGQLKKKNIKRMLLLSCNAGHQDWKLKNVAHAFRGKIKGPVVASDGTVKPSYRVPAEKTFSYKSVLDITWDTYTRSRRDTSYGWVKYLSRSNCKRSKKKSMTLDGLLSY